MLKSITLVAFMSLITITAQAQTPQVSKAPTLESVQLTVLTNIADTFDICGVNTVARRKLDFAINYYGGKQTQYTEAEFSLVRAKTKAFLTKNTTTICQPYTTLPPQSVAEMVDTMVGQGPQNNGENFTR